MQSSDVVALIENGGLDVGLYDIRAAVERRIERAARQFVASLKPGQRATLVGMKNAKLNGLRGTVQDTYYDNSVWFVFDQDQDLPKRASQYAEGGVPIWVHGSNLRLIDVG